MDYNWGEIFKNKTNKELYKIYLGDTLLPLETKVFAFNELKKRKFDFDNLSKEKKKFELERLIEEQNPDKSFFFRSSNSTEFLMMGICGACFALIAIILFFVNIFGKISIKQENSDILLFFLAGCTFSIIGFKVWKIRKEKEINRENRIKELINEL